VDTVETTAKRLGVSVETLITRAAHAKHFTHMRDIIRNRYERWIKYGEIPPFVEEYCIQHTPVSFSTRRVEVT